MIVKLTYCLYLTEFFLDNIWPDWKVMPLMVLYLLIGRLWVRLTSLLMRVEIHVLEWQSWCMRSQWRWRYSSLHCKRCILLLLIHMEWLERRLHVAVYLRWFILKWIPVWWHWTNLRPMNLSIHSWHLLLLKLLRRNMIWIDQVLMKLRINHHCLLAWTRSHDILLIRIVKILL